MHRTEVGDGTVSVTRERDRVRLEFGRGYQLMTPDEARCFAKALLHSARDADGRRFHLTVFAHGVR